MKARHSFNNPRSDTGDATKAQPSHWNAPHPVDLDGVSTNSAAQIKPAFDVDWYVRTGQNVDLFFENSDTAAVEMWGFVARIKDDGTARAITYNTQFVAVDGLSLPSTTVVGKTMYMGFLWNNSQVKWVLQYVNYSTP